MTREERETQKASEKERLELERFQAEADLRAVLATPTGRRFVWRLIEQRCGLMSGVFAATHAEMAYAEGKRSVGRELLADAQRVAPPQAIDMVREWTAQHQERQLKKP